MTYPVAEVFGTFLKLGLTSFGGPIAHLGFFRDEIVTRRKWLDDQDYTSLVALCQFLPGPTSSQVGFALGLRRAGWFGALAAFVAFTAPSAVLMVLFAHVAAPLPVDGLKLVAVAIVAQAVLGMVQSLCPDRARATIAIAAVGLLAVLPIWAMPVVIALGAAAGMAVLHPQPAPPAALRLVRKWVAAVALIAFLAFFLFLPARLDGFYRAGSLVFGGGHVVLPLLQAELGGAIPPEAFLAGYAAAQAVPGPLFTFAAYLGAVLDPAGPAAVLALVAIFLPGFLILIAALPFHAMLGTSARAGVMGANAAVVGVLGAALYDPIFTSAVGSAGDFALVLAMFGLLVLWKAPPWLVVMIGLGVSVALR